MSSGFINDIKQGIITELVLSSTTNSNANLNSQNEDLSGSPKPSDSIVSISMEPPCVTEDSVIDSSLDDFLDRKVTQNISLSYETEITKSSDNLLTQELRLGGSSYPTHDNSLINHLNDSVSISLSSNESDVLKESENEHSCSHSCSAIDDEFESNDMLNTLESKMQRRRSSKRAMSSSLDEYAKVKTRISFDSLKVTSSHACNNSPRGDQQEKFDTDDTETITNKPYTQSWSFHDPFHFQMEYFSNHKFIPFSPHCKLISNDECIAFLTQTYNKKLPDVDTVFPWLHGIHSNNYGQINFLTSTFNNGGHNKVKVISFEKPTPLDECSLSSDDDDDDYLDYAKSEYADGKGKEKDSDDDDPITAATRTPPVRFLMPVRSCNSNGEVSSDYLNIFTDSTGLIKGTVSAEDILVSYSNISHLELFLKNTLPQEVFEFYHPETIATDCIITQLVPVFKNLDPEVGINLRNFHIQASKVSNVSDFIVYCFNHQDHEFNMSSNNDIFVNNKCKCVNLARLLHIAQIVYQKKHPELIKGQKSSELLNSKKFNTFILSDPHLESLKSTNLLSIPILEESSTVKKEDELCSLYDINVFNNWDSNYLYRERLEISKMSTASPLQNNIWLGNITDFECLQIQLNNNKEVTTAAQDTVKNLLREQSINPLYCNQSNTIVKLTKEDFEKKSFAESDKLLISFPFTNWKFYIKCIELARLPSLEQLKLIYENYKECSYINIEFPPSGSISLADMSDDDILSIVNICKFCYYISGTEFPTLIYCSDGYTESSLLALCYLMYSENIALDEAILKLHSNYGRPFFIFKTDYVLLGKLEIILNKYSPINTLSTETKEDFKFESDSKSIRSLLLKPKRKVGSFGNSVGSVGSVGNSFGTQFGNSVGNSFGSNAVGNTSFITKTGHHVVQLRGNQSVMNSNQYQGSISKFGVNNPNFFKPKSILKPTNLSISGCFEEVNGSLPSRILQHMYLGSLLHASCIPLLSRLKIEFIISVGERISWCNSFKHDKTVFPSGAELLKFSSGQVDKESGYELNVKKILIVPNINDDGIGSLISTIDSTLEFIDECHSINSKCLVHCQVGVSRSASICIAEVMKRLKVSLPRAYMFVRVRRLNVIIQPNLKLMYELFKWEENFLESRKLQVPATDSISQSAVEIDICKSNRKDSTSSTSSTLFTNTPLKSERSSLSITRGNSLTSFNGTNPNSKLKFGSICEGQEQSFGLNSEIEHEEALAERLNVHVHLLEYVYDVISNNRNFIREVDWHIFCREIYNLNRAYIKSN